MRTPTTSPAGEAPPAGGDVTHHHTALLIAALLVALLSALAGVLIGSFVGAILGAGMSLAGHE